MDLINKLMKRKKKTILVNFGDHLPSFEGYSTQLRFTRDIKDYYKTFYNITANFDISEYTNKDEKYPVLDITFIPGIILDIAGLNDNDFYKANSFIRKKCNGEIKNCVNIDLNKYNLQETEFIHNLLESYKSLIIKQLDF